MALRSLRLCSKYLGVLASWVVKYDVDLHASPFELCDYIPGKKKAGILSHSGVDWQWGCVCQKHALYQCTLWCPSRWQIGGYYGR